jgi:hypothetical protein
VATSTPPTAPRAQRPLEGLDLLDEVDLLPVRFLDPAAWAVTSILARRKKALSSAPRASPVSCRWAVSRTSFRTRSAMVSASGDI